MSERVTDETVEDEEPEPQPSTAGAGVRGPPTKVGAGFGDDSGDPLDPSSLAERWNMPIEDLDLSMRGYNCLRRSGYMTVGQVLESSEELLLGLQNFGRGSYDELRERLNKLRLLPLDAKLGPGKGPSTNKSRLPLE
jgi:hypothetical protein